MKKNSKKKLQELILWQLEKKQLTKLKGGDDYIGTEDVVDG